jgi:hypothetical protein
MSIEIDPKGLIKDSYLIEGITSSECRSIFVDWALSIETAEPAPLLEALLERFADMPEDHPMTAVLKEGLQRPTQTGRRGGRAARVTPAWTK